MADQTTSRLWTEKYRPRTLDEYVFRDPNQRQTVEQWLSQGEIPHLILSGVSGTGKTSMAKLLLRLLDVPSGDILDINASRERNVETVQNKIINFVSTWALGPSNMKYVLLDEADALSLLAQKVLRGEIERNPDTRFILTANFPEKIMPAIHGRCQGFHFTALDRDDFTARVGEILVKEDISFDVDTLVAHVDAAYPDLRKCINNVQQSVIDGALGPLEETEAVSKDWLISAADLFRSGRTLEGRKMVVAQAQVDEYPEVFRYLYQNLDLWGDTQQQKDDALMIIRNAVLGHNVACDVEINLSACLCELTRIRQN